MTARGALVFVGALALAAAPDAAGQVITENGGVISPQTPILRESVSFLQTAQVKELRWGNQLIVSAPGIPLEAKVTLPVVYRHVEVAGGGGREDLFGVGDLSVRLKQSLWQTDAVMASTRFAALAEVTLPTGNTTRRTEGSGSRLASSSGRGRSPTAVAWCSRSSATGIASPARPSSGTRRAMTASVQARRWT